MKVEVYWCNSDGSLARAVLELPLGQASLCTIAQALLAGQASGQLPRDLPAKIQSGAFEVACFGRDRSMDSLLSEGDRIELLGPVLLDVKAERSARVKAARARERGPYNRSYSGPTKPTRT
jgi:putative ubiquitin-RnfH superfamily antitoxin RatB of RatAB toxin-antitoxin module